MYPSVNSESWLSDLLSRFLIVASTSVLPVDCFQELLLVADEQRASLIGARSHVAEKTF